MSITVICTGAFVASLVSGASPILLELPSHHCLSVLASCAHKKSIEPMTLYIPLRKDIMKLKLTTVIASTGAPIRLVWFGILLFIGTFSTNRLCHVIEVQCISRRAGEQRSHTVEQ